MGEYKIKEVEILTGIKAHTLRIWEKRYGIPSPNRTATKIRTYSDDDLKELLNVSILNKSGIKISHIVDFTEDQKSAKLISLRSKETSCVYQENLLLALLDIDEHLFHATFNQLVEQYGLEETYSVHLAEFLDRIGILWISGAIEPGQEHFISHLIRQKIVATTDQLPIPSKDKPKVLMFLPENEWHDISMLYYHYLLRKNGIYSFYLGQSLPYDAIIDCVDLLKPHALLTSSVVANEEGWQQNFFRKLKTEIGEIPIFVSGAQAKLHYEELKEWVQPMFQKEDLEKLIDFIGE